MDRENNNKGIRGEKAMSVYNCDICGGCYCCDENPCHESALSKFGLICDDCAIENSCYYCGEYSADVRYCKITDQRYHEKCAH